MSVFWNVIQIDTFLSLNTRISGYGTTEGVLSAVSRTGGKHGSKTAQGYLQRFILDGAFYGDRALQHHLGDNASITKKLIVDETLFSHHFRVIG